MTCVDQRMQAAQRQAYLQLPLAKNGGRLQSRHCKSVRQLPWYHAVRCSILPVSVFDNKESPS